MVDIPDKRKLKIKICVRRGSPSTDIACKTEQQNLNKQRYAHTKIQPEDSRPARGSLFPWVVIVYWCTPAQEA